MATTAKIVDALSTEYHFITMGAVETKRTRLVPVTRKNVDGVAYQLHGTGGEPSAVRAIADVVAADAAALKVIIDAYVALQGQLVSVTDDHGITLTGILVMEVRIPLWFEAQGNPHKIRTPVGGQNGTNGTHVICVEFVLVDTNV